MERIKQRSKTMECDTNYVHRDYLLDCIQRVLKWKFKYSKDNIIWTDVDGGAEFVGNTDSATKVYQTFAEPVVAGYIRFYPQTYNNHVSARMALVVEPLPGHISVYLDGQKDTGASQGVNDNYISIPSSAKWSIGSGFSVVLETSGFFLKISFILTQELKDATAKSKIHNEISFFIYG